MPHRERTRALALSVGLLLVAVVLGLAIVATMDAPAPMRATGAESKTVQYSYSELLRAAEKGDIAQVTYDASASHAEAELKEGTKAEATLPPDSSAFLDKLAAEGVDVEVKGAGRTSGGGSILAALLPTLVLFGLIILVMAVIRRRAMKGGGFMGGAGVPDTSLRKNAQLTEVPLERFRDVAGADEAVEELREVTEFFTAAERFRALGARMPSGIILYGDPGTGKTLLAKALAGEAGIPFYACSGSDFVEKFVGVGAGRVRELFAKARSHPEGAVVFIDEIDAVGRARGASEGNGEREQTLNQLLVELDGFSTNDRVICIAATNRLDVLDPALLRPGRFGRHIAVPLPAAAGRTQILGLHSAGRPLADDVDLEQLAGTMGGLSGAQLAEVVNEAAIMAAREDESEIRREHFREGYLRVLAGPKRKNAPIADGELEVIAAHEAGHVLAAEYGERYEKAQQVTVEPRGQAMGLAVYGQRDRALHDPEYLHEALVATLAGRAAEQLIFGRISSGAANDLQKATELARRAIEELGFSQRLGQIVRGRAPFSERTREVVDAEIERMVATAYTDALAVLGEHRVQLDRLRERLFEQRVLERVDILAAIGNVTPLHERKQRRAGSSPSAVPMAASVQTGDLTGSITFVHSYGGSR
jgi:cell division protease FtsH